MLAAILENLNSPLVLSDINIQPLDIGQVLVEVYSSGICGAQLGEIQGRKGQDKYLPHLLGHEGAGIVLKTGPGVTHVKPDDHVVMHWRKGHGIEAKPPKYSRENTLIGAGPIATFSEQAVISENRLTIIDKDIPFDVAALMGCAVTTGLGVINNDAKLKIGESIVISGCGGVGLNIVQGAAMVSGNPIIAIDRYSKKLYMAEEFGATHSIDSDDEKIEDEIYDITRGDGVDVFVDCTGDTNIIEKGFAVIAKNGRLIMVGQPSHEKSLTISNIGNHFHGKTIMDSQGGGTCPTKDIPRYLDLYRNNKLNLDDLITHKFPLEQINEAIEIVKSGEAGRCIITMR